MKLITDKLNKNILLFEASQLLTHFRDKFRESKATEPVLREAVEKISFLGQSFAMSKKELELVLDPKNPIEIWYFHRFDVETRPRKIRLIGPLVLVVVCCKYNNGAFAPSQCWRVEADEEIVFDYQYWEYGFAIIQSNHQENTFECLYS